MAGTGLVMRQSVSFAAMAVQGVRAARAFAAGCMGLTCVLLVGCIGSNPTYPLYPNPEQERPAAEVAILTGDVAIVDGKDVSSHGRTFALEPGCHIVSTPKRDGGTSSSATFWADIGEISFAINMKARFRYVVRVNFAQTNGTGGHVSVTAREEHLDGSVFRQFVPIRGRPPNGSCLARGTWTPVAE